MKIVISNDEGEVYVTAVPTSIGEAGPVRVRDDEGDEVLLEDLVVDAAVWERQLAMRRAAR